MTGTLTIMYRSPTPLYTPLTFARSHDRIDGRKVFTRGTMHAGDRLCAEADGIFILVEPRPLRGAHRGARRRHAVSDVMSERRVALGGPVNFRDLGGYPTADGRTRPVGAPVPQRLAAPPRAGRRAAPRTRSGIATAIDFRADDELDRIGIGRLGELDIRHLHLPTVDRALHARAPPTSVDDRAPRPRST